MNLYGLKRPFTTDKAQVGLYKAGDAFNVTFSPTLDVTNRQRSANAAEHISTR